MISVLHVGRSGTAVQRLLSASDDPPICVCSVPTVQASIAGSDRWQPDCWVCEEGSLPTDPTILQRLESTVAGAPVLVLGDGSIPTALEDWESVRSVTNQTLADAVVDVTIGTSERVGSRSSAVLLSLLDRASDRIARLDRDGTYRSISDELGALLGVPASQAVGTTLADHSPAADAAVLREHGERAIDTGTIQCHETDTHRYLFVPVGGSQFHLVVQNSTDGETDPVAEPATDFIDTVLNRLTDVFFIFDLQGRFLYWNERLNEVTGYTDEEIASMTPLAFFVREDYGRVEAAFSEIADTGDATETVRIRTKDGRLLPYEFTGSIVPNESGTARYVCGIARDVSRRQHAERALRDRQQALPNLIRNLPGVVFRYRNETGYPIEFMGQGCADLTGYPLDRFESGEVSWSEGIVHPEDREQVQARIREAVETGEQYQSTYRIRTADGTLRWVWEQGGIVETPDGSIDYLDSYVFEITDIVRIQRAFRRERAFIESALDAQPDLFYVFTLDGRIHRWNDRFGEVTGYTDEEIASMHPTEFVAADDAEAVLGAMTEVTTDERPLSVEATLVTKEGERIPYEFVGSVIEDVDGPVSQYATGTNETYVCGTGRDITQRVRAEAELEEAIADLERSNAELERFAYVASHDLKEPLRMVHSYLDLIRHRYEDELDEDADEFIEYATDGAERMRQMIDDLLTYSRIGTSDAEFDSVDCHVVVDRVLGNLQVAIEEADAEITVDSLPTVIADDQQLIQLFQNLVANAVSYTSEEEPKVHISATEIDGGWRFSISDNGIGIPEEKCEEVFEVFSSGSNGTDSTGIGLAICKKIVARHGGEIWVESTPNVGSTFYFTLSKDDRPADRSGQLLDV